MAEETVHLNVRGAYISNARVILNETTYSIPNITSVKTVSRGINGCLIGVCIVSVLAGSITVFLSILIPFSVKGSLLIAVPVGLFGLVLAATFVYIWRTVQTEEYVVIISTASGEHVGFLSTDIETAESVKSAIETVISR